MWEVDLTFVADHPTKECAIGGTNLLVKQIINADFSVHRMIRIVGRDKSRTYIRAVIKFVGPDPIIEDIGGREERPREPTVCDTSALL